MRVWVTAALLALAACGGSKFREPDEYVGCAADEHWHTFDDQEPFAVVGDTQAPTFLSPPDGQTTTTKIRIDWSVDATTVGTPGGDVPHDGPGCTACCPQWNLGALGALHLPPISGDIYDLQFVVGGAIDHRVLTTLQAWTPSDAVWAGWRGKTVTLQIWRMTLIKNDLRPAEGGPFTSGRPFTFTVG